MSRIFHGWLGGRRDGGGTEEKRGKEGKKKRIGFYDQFIKERKFHEISIEEVLLENTRIRKEKDNSSSPVKKTKFL